MRVFLRDYVMQIKRLEIYYSLLNIKFKSTEDIIDKLQQLKALTKQKFHQSISNY